MAVSELWHQVDYLLFLLFFYDEAVWKYIILCKLMLCLKTILHYNNFIELSLAQGHAC